MKGGSGHCTFKPPMQVQPIREALAWKSFISSCHTQSPADGWMEKALHLGFAKIIWKALGLPAASCLLKGDLQCREQPDTPMLLQPVPLNPATL